MKPSILKSFLAIKALQYGGALGLFGNGPSAPRILRQNVLGIDFPNPLGVAAGFDKNANVYKYLGHFGFGYVEVGTVLQYPHSGNRKKQIYHLKEDMGIINDLGLPSDGEATVYGRLWNNHNHIVGVNIGSTYDIFYHLHEAVRDYKELIYRFGRCANYLTINLSCPNLISKPSSVSLPFSADLALNELFREIHSALKEKYPTLPVLLKISPDLSYDILCKYVDGAMKYKFDGLVIGNSTLTRPSWLLSNNKQHCGGLSGKPLFKHSTIKLAHAYKRSNGKLLLIGVGGIDSAETAYEKICAGASLIQLYSGMVYHGYGLARKILTELPYLLKCDGYTHISEAIGSKTDFYATMGD